MKTVQEVYADLRDSIGVDLNTTVSLTGHDPVTPSVHRIGDGAAAALGLLGAAMSGLGELRGGARQIVTVDVEDAISQLMAVFLTTVNGVPAERLFEDPSLFADSDFYRAGDGRYVYLLLTYPHLRALACQVLGCPPSRRHYADAIARWDAFALEDAISGAGGTCVAVRTQAEWRSHPQGRYLAERPLIEITRIGDTQPLPLPGERAALPMEGLRVLDNTHVIAGPIAARLMAEHGAEVLHLSTPRYPDPQAMQVETNIGKRSAWCDLDEPAGRAAFERVLGDADIYVGSYLSLDRKGYGPLALAERRPGIVVLDFHCWGKAGPWSQRGGFDQLACAATGFSAEEGAFDGPRLPPTYLLNDYLAAILGAAGVAEALRRRAVEGGTYHVHLDLARVCMWIQDLGLLSREQVIGLPPPNAARLKDRCVRVPGPFGETTYLPTRINYSDIRPVLSRGAEPLGASACAWIGNSAKAR
ncbi:MULTISPECIES: CoA transferase [Pseudoxanthomonas]|uniref:Crotonobetainyl-CoA:carnitine CoA-transferase CaiB-like acyl-CoA transferase n=1 Tax=Pseudoxanthomonas winnipegensis TaxID=2480810 RepID=A0AAW8GCY4_9GAMM|nr:MULTISPECIES: CoA transferase [Pseudoxanthomonas]MDQ1119100.1 crotonobetainyl-CoA:carnitine CoA-transferase CaiB-like acyl-CoA transferase [Pseudoxanthomonas winnipegensis]MDQ1132290.1 crotonobetainyl-CoA:carnitine CoA-transferase CaiB-like acyl-CoA transferase [Pseudoxanthomonas winnipegensis]MDR6137697.1 crotonobetainyl-CoA:carnitine CoA-transferase CaiB-like acyl-CoA transferase [Pseudoxanthomonas sp. SORGH_AS_0997]